MIRINLLPKELQSAAKTPFILFTTFIAGVALAAVSLFVYGYLWFNVIVLEERVERKREEVAQLQSNATKVDSLLDDIADYKEREKAIISIKTNRILWSKKLDELSQITPAFIWIVSLDMKEYDPRDTDQNKSDIPTGGYLELACYASGDEVERMTLFRQRLKSADEFYMGFLDEKIKPETFYTDFINISHPEWRFVLLPGYRESSNIRFSVRLDLRPLVTTAPETEVSA